MNEPPINGADRITEFANKIEQSLHSYAGGFSVPIAIPEYDENGRQTGTSNVTAIEVLDDIRAILEDMLNEMCYQSKISLAASNLTEEEVEAYEAEQELKHLRRHKRSRKK